MNTKVLIATLTAAVAAFLFGWLVFGILLADFYASNTPLYQGLMKDPPDLLMIFISNIFSAFLLAYIFNRWAGIKTAGEGAQAGAIIFVIMAIGFDLMMYSMMNMLTPLVIAVDVIGNALLGAVIGAVTGYVLGTGKKVVSV